MTDKTMFTELDQYQWYRDVDELEKHSNLNMGDRLMSEIPPAPISLVLAILEEMVSRPEVVAAWSSETVEGLSEGKIGYEEGLLLLWFEGYLTHKYGNETNAVGEAGYHILDLINGVYSGVDDPKLRATLLADDSIYDDEAGSA